MLELLKKNKRKICAILALFLIVGSCTIRADGDSSQEKMVEAVVCEEAPSAPEVAAYTPEEETIGKSLEPCEVIRDLGEPKDEVIETPIIEEVEVVEEYNEPVQQSQSNIQETEQIPQPETKVETEEIIEEPKESEELEEEIIEEPDLEDVEVEVEVETEAEVAPAPTTYYAGGAPIDIDFLAKLMWAEGGTMSWNGQVYLCSAILNLCDMTGKSVWTAGHTYNMFSVAYIVDGVTPSQTQYDVINYVLNGGRVPGVAFFRTDYYHSFGTPLCAIDNVYFSTP